MYMNIYIYICIYGCSSKPTNREPAMAPLEATSAYYRAAWTSKPMARADWRGWPRAQGVRLFEIKKISYHII